MRTRCSLVLLVLQLAFNVPKSIGQSDTADASSFGEVYQSVYHEDIYSFLDELANAKIIHINSTVKPYSRIFIAKKLNEALGKLNQLNKRQTSDLNFYLKDFNKELKPDKNFKRRLDLFYYKDTLFSITLNPILGLSGFNNDSAGFYHRWSGAEVFGYLGKNFGYYASLRDNHESKVQSDPAWLNQLPGADYKLDNKGGGDYDEMRGGITYSWKWGSLGLIKDQFVWGDNEHGANIFSGRSPSFTHLRLNIHPVSWLDFNYIHGWLVSNLIDSTKIYYANGTVNRLVMRTKYVAANMVTVSVFHGLDVSIGNSIVYGDQPVNPAYLVPIFFYKSVDHELNSAGSNYLGQNSQMYFNISSRNIKNVHLYTSWFIDEINFGNVWDKDKQSNFISAKFGAHVSNLGLPNLFATAEYTRTNPITYRHYVGTSPFTNDLYNLGHYLVDNSQEIFLSLGYKPLAKLYVEFSYSKAQKGIVYPYNGGATPDGTGKGNPFLTTVNWQANIVDLKARYQILNDRYLFVSAASSDYSGVDVKKYTSPEFIGKQTTINLGANVGF